MRTELVTTARNPMSVASCLENLGRVWVSWKGGGYFHLKKSCILKSTLAPPMISSDNSF